MLPRVFRRFSTTTQDQLSIAFFGLGNMGKFMSKNLARSGHKIYGFDFVKQAEEDCKGHCVIGADPKEVCSTADMVITNITNTQAVQKFYVENGYFDIVRKDAVMLDTSTIDPLSSKKLTEVAKSKGKTFIDCPMSGGVVGAEKAT